MKHCSWRVFMLIILCVSSVSVCSQTQQRGIVKTRGRMVNGKLVPGIMLGNATVQIKGHNSIVSRTDGGFSFPVSGAKAYLLQGAHKQGYQMVDAEACREYRPSATPLYIVMETPEQQRADYRQAQSRIRRNLQRQLQEREAEIEQLNIRQVQKDSLLDLLYQQQSDNEKLITDMARRYSEIDYDQLDDFYRQVSYSIEQGLLTRADSLLRSRGDVGRQVEQQLQAGQAIKAEEEKVQRDRQMHTQVNDELARRCYSYFETFNAQFLRDSAFHYLELRARLDSTNQQWLTDCGLYLSHEMANFDKALDYFKCCLRQSLAVDSGKNIGAAAAYNNIGLVYELQENRSLEALEYLLKGMLLVKELKGSDYSEIAKCYNNIGAVYSSLGIEELNKDYALKALAISEKLQEDTVAIVNIYTSLGVHYQEQSNFPLALEYLQKAYELSKSVNGEKSQRTATIINNIGGLYSYMADVPKALEYYSKALTMRQQVLGDLHPDVAYSFDNIASVYYKQQEYSQSMEYSRKALSIWEKRHDVGQFSSEYFRIANCYAGLGDRQQALSYLQKSLEAQGEDTPNSIVIYQRLAELYSEMQDSIHAAEYQQKAGDLRKRYTASDGAAGQKAQSDAETVADHANQLGNQLRALAIVESVLGPEHPDVAEVLAAIGDNYCWLNDTDKAAGYLNRALTMRRQLYGEESLKVALSFKSYSVMFSIKDEHSQALTFILKAKAIVGKLLGNSHSEMASVEMMEAVSYIRAGHWEQAVQTLRHVLTINENTWGADHINTAIIINGLVRCYYSMGDYQNALSCSQRVLQIYERVYGPNHTMTQEIRSNIATEQEEIRKIEESHATEVITLTPSDEDSPARQQGMEGEYVILEYNGWQIGNEDVFARIFEENLKQPKTILVIKDNVITIHRFDEKIGALLKSKKVEKTVKDQFKEAYRRWKAQNG